VHSLTDRGTVPYPCLTTLGTRYRLLPNTVVPMTSCNKQNTSSVVLYHQHCQHKLLLIINTKYY